MGRDCNLLNTPYIYDTLQVLFYISDCDCTTLYASIFLNLINYSICIYVFSQLFGLALEIVV